ncbi:anti-sigma factor domain-containing protein [Deinococcus hopiensis]|uniref:Regulator of SigK n=1 Tax=Deinococcus hopiensis KR-140 TaxID=695939 RepID=A0A1W1VLP0_9DEIO|nr:anti-sigma factor [Deinococcus hopiensis]SMB94236.1 Anti-sigma-K factor RskA [Deinococcus hopiensis KR-140]
MSADLDTLTAYALGILSPEEEARVEAALDRDPALRARVQAERESLLTLVESLPEVELPAGAEERLMVRLSTERGQASPTNLHLSPPVQTSTPRRVPWLPLSAAGIAAALALAFALRPSADPLRQYAETPGAVTQPLAVNGARIGDLVRMGGGRAYLHLSAPPEAGRVYQMWQIQGKTPVPLGVFEGQGFLLTGLSPGATVAVSVEPPGGSPQPTTKPILVQQL